MAFMAPNEWRTRNKTIDNKTINGSWWSALTTSVFDFNEQLWYLDKIGYTIFSRLFSIKILDTITTTCLREIDIKVNKYLPNEAHHFPAGQGLQPLSPTAL